MKLPGQSVERYPSARKSEAQGPPWGLVHLRPKSWLTLVFVVLLLAHLAPIWFFDYFPSQDGPVHLENANILLNYGSENCPVLGEYYLLNYEPNPNWMGHFLLVGLLYFSPRS